MSWGRLCTFAGHQLVPWTPRRKCPHPNHTHRTATPPTQSTLLESGLRHVEEEQEEDHGQYGDYEEAVRLHNASEVCE